MNVVIIEDEPLLAGHLRDLLSQIDPLIKVLSTPDSVKSAVSWFKQHQQPDLTFMDIQLGDGLSFEIFNRLELDCPVIFTTAYQEYAIRAFKVNSVDYLLKPITENDLRNAIKKYQLLYSAKETLPPLNRELVNNIRHMISNPSKARFMVKVGDRIKSVETKDILYFFSLQKGTYLHTTDKRNYVIDYTLDALVEMLDPAQYQRINRQYIVSHAAIDQLITLSGTKLKVELLHSDDERIYVSRDRIQSFKQWLDQ